MAEEAAEKVFPSAALTQRLEAAVDSAAATARVELVPFQTSTSNRADQLQKHAGNRSRH